jgi:hypothetical protein
VVYTVTAYELNERYEKSPRLSYLNSSNSFISYHNPTKRRQ